MTVTTILAASERLADARRRQTAAEHSIVWAVRHAAPESLPPAVRRALVAYDSAVADERVASLDMAEATR